MKTNFIPAKAAVKEFLRFTGHEGKLDKTDLVAWANDAVERLTSDEQLVHRIVLLPVKNYIVQLPEGFTSVVQAAYRDKSPRCTPRVEISQYTQKVLGTGCDLKIDVQCPECHEESCNCGAPIVEVDVDRLWKTSHPQYSEAYVRHFYDYGGNVEIGGGRLNQSVYHPEFRLMKYTTSSFFNIPYHLDNCLNFSVDCEVEYSINHPTMNVNFKDGEVLLSYLGTRLDEDGYRMIPDHPVAIRAISYAMAERFLYIEYMKTFEQKNRIAWQMHVELAEKWIARARAQLQTPGEDEFMNFVKKFMHKVVPEHNYEENLYRGRSKKYQFKYPNQTNNIGDYSDTGGNVYRKR